MGKIYNILIIDDDLSTLELFELLGKLIHNIKIFTAINLNEAEKIIENNLINIVFIDIVNYPNDGYEITKYLKCNENTKNSYYILISSERKKLSDRINGFILGVDEFLLKPIDLKELELIIRNKIIFLDNYKKINNSEIEKNNLFLLDKNLKTLKFKDKDIILSNLEFKIISFFIDNPEKFFSSDELAEKIWGSKYKVTPDNVRGLILKIRNKIEDYPNKPIYIINSKSRGYIFYPEGNTID